MGRNNSEFEILAAEADSDADRSSGMILNPHNRGILLTINVGTLTTTPTFTPKLRIQDAGGSWHTVWTAAAAISSAGSYVYYLAPFAVAGVGTFTEIDAIPIPSSYQIQLIFGGSGSADTEVRAFSLV